MRIEITAVGTIREMRSPVGEVYSSAIRIAGNAPAHIAATKKRTNIVTTFDTGVKCKPATLESHAVEEPKSVFELVQIFGYSTRNHEINLGVRMIKNFFLAAIIFLAIATPAFAYDMGDTPEFIRGHKIVGNVPPEGSVPETDQWPLVSWFEYEGVQFGIYAKHIDGYNPDTGAGHFEVWISAPPQYIAEVEQDHPFGPADANEYLSRTGHSSMVAQFYEGPGDYYIEPVGYEPWTSSTDRLLLTVLEAPNNGVAPKAFALHEVYLGSLSGPMVMGGHVLCFCPNYEHGESVASGEEWIYYLDVRDTSKVKCDQWGLPGCSPVPLTEVTHDTPITATTPGTTTSTDNLVVTTDPVSDFEPIVFNETNLGNVIEFVRGRKIIGYVPPEGEVPETNQWPIVAWLEYEEVQFGIYAKHIDGYNSSTMIGHWEVWIAPPPEYIQEVERDHPYGPTDGIEYLRRTGYDSMVARFYEGPGDHYIDPVGYVPWTSSTDRCLITVLEAPNDGLAPKAFALHEVYLGSLSGPLVMGGHILCFCPDYEDGEGLPSGEEWIYYLETANYTKTKIDQWGLPGCSPVR